MFRPGDSKTDTNNQVNLDDLSVLAGSYMASVGNPAYNPMADFDRSGQVNLAGLSLLAGNYMKSSPIEVP